MKKTSPNFEAFFSELYGERWPALESALASQVKTVVSLNASDASCRVGALNVALGEREAHYQMDLASLLAVLALPVDKGQRILDLCCAPGGKSLATVLRLGGDAEFVMNDLSEPRLVRAKRVMKEFSSIYGEDSLQFFKRDASRWGLHEPEAYDAVICDVPCSGEGHGAAQAGAEAKWSLKTVKSLSKRQIAIACSAFDALKPGGYMLYSTCSVNPIENDGVVEKLMKKRKEKIEFVEDSWTSLLHSIEAQSSELESKIIGVECEQAGFGQQLFPDRSAMGPIYFSVLRKKI
ncbi:MAG: methyltransferase domain-containing protein [Bdellovibrionales bacterium]|nr:methyltransferase domain-containing protein [Bdellovibrionales bacterium]